MCVIFGEFIKEKRKNMNYSLRAFAKAVGISPVYQSSIENGKRSAPSYEILVNMAEVLGLDKYEKNIMYDLAANTKNNAAVAYDLVYYINDNERIREALRLSKECNINNSDWENIVEYIKENYI